MFKLEFTLLCTKHPKLQYPNRPPKLQTLGAPNPNPSRWHFFRRHYPIQWLVFWSSHVHLSKSNQGLGVNRGGKNWFNRTSPSEKLVEAVTLLLDTALLFGASCEGFLWRWKLSQNLQFLDSFLARNESNLKAAKLCNKESWTSWIWVHLIYCIAQLWQVSLYDPAPKWKLTAETENIPSRKRRNIDRNHQVSNFPAVSSFRGVYSITIISPFGTNPLLSIQWQDSSSSRWCFHKNPQVFTGCKISQRLCCIDISEWFHKYEIEC